MAKRVTLHIADNVSDSWIEIDGERLEVLGGLQYAESHRGVTVTLTLASEATEVIDERSSARVEEY